MPNRCSRTLQLPATEPKTLSDAELSSPGMAKVLFLGVTLAVLQQWCGINVIFNYAQEIFAAAGYQISDILFNIVYTGVVNVVFHAGCAGYHRSLRQALSAAFRSLRAGDHLHGLGTALSLAYAGHAHAGAGACGHRCYAMSLAPVTWVVIAEIFPNRIRGGAISIAVTALWTACFRAYLYFPLLECSSGHGRRVLDLCGYLPCWIGFFISACRKQGESPRRN